MPQEETPVWKEGMHRNWWPDSPGGDERGLTWVGENGGVVKGGSSRGFWRESNRFKKFIIVMHCHRRNAKIGHPSGGTKVALKVTIGRYPPPPWIRTWGDASHSLAHPSARGSNTVNWPPRRASKSGAAS